jgi:ribosomal protein S18 acetylase RimI-like enzyme
MVHLRPATPADSPFLAALEREVMEAHAQALWGQFHPAVLSAFDLSNTRVALFDGQPVGFLMVEREDRHLRLRKLYLAPGVQGRGWGRQLLALVRREAEATNLTLRLSVLRPNTRALAFYQREGMVEVESTPDRIFLEMPRARICVDVLETTASPL